jgi:HAD superfamily hydrolase (TIGR01509 family)
VEGLKAIIFDMDGTLTESYINWPELRAQINCPPEKTIIEHIDSLPSEQAQQANDILLKTEWEAAQHAAIRDGAPELIDALRDRDLKLAVVTNNHGAAMHRVIQRLNRSFDATFSRDDGPIKPDPYLIHKALQTLNVSPHETISIGDSRYDLMACAAANVRCIHLTDGTSELNHEHHVTKLNHVMPLLNQF